MQSDSHPKVYVISHIRKLTAEETRNFLEPLATWVLVLALALGVVIAALSLVAWWDDLSAGASFPRGTQKPPVPSVDFDGMTSGGGWVSRTIKWRHFAIRTRSVKSGNQIARHGS